MSISQTLAKAQHSVVVGRIDEALKLYRRLLRVVPKHPLVNSLLGEALARSGSPHAAVPHLRLAHTGEPRNVDHWIKLIATLHMVDEVVEARGLLAMGANMGVEPARLKQLETLLSEPLSMSLDTLRRRIKMGKRTEAQISAHMLVASYPNSQAAQACFDDALAIPT